MPGKKHFELFSKLGPGLCALILLGTTASAQETFTICIGQQNSGCRPPTDAWFSCGTSPQQAGSAICTKSTTAGQSKREFSTTVLETFGGGMCGYIKIAVTCK